MTVKVQKVFGILGVQPGEEFNITEHPEELFRITENLVVEIIQKETNKCETCNGISYKDFLLDRFEIVRISQITRRDRIALDYARAFGCKYIAADKNGTFWGYEKKPVKQTTVWGSNGGQMYQIYLPVSFISWEDKEPYYLGGENDE